MDPRLLQAYNDELIYLRQTSQEFASEHPSVAGRLGLGAVGDVDPHVERLLEGVAFLGTRVQLKLQDQFGDFTQHLLNAIQPHYLAPTPSMCVVAFEPREGDVALAHGIDVPRHTAMRGTAADRDQTPVTFRTGQAVTLWPLQLIEAEYLPGRSEVAPFIAGHRGVPVEAGLRLRFAATGGAKLETLHPGRVPLYLDGAGPTPGELYRQMIGDAVAVVARPAGSADDVSAGKRLPVPVPHGFAEDQGLLPGDKRSHRGYRLLGEYFACPERFLFVGLDGLADAFAACAGHDACDVVILFGQSADALARAVSPGNFRLFATPAINLFEKQLDRMAMDAFTHERQVIPDRTRPLDYEVYRILDVRAHGHEATEVHPVAPLYDFAGLLHDWDDALFYVSRLRPRRLSTREQRARARGDYVGVEHWISMSAPGRPDRLEEIRELSIRALVTNRELPMRMRTGEDALRLEEGFPVRTTTILRAPTRPRPPLALGDAAWQVIGHLTPNFTAFAGARDGDAALLRRHLALYGQVDDPGVRRQVEGVRAIRSSPVSRRAPGQGSGAILRGQRLHITLDESGFENGRAFLFSAVLDRFLAEFAAVNSFIETAFDSLQRGGFAQWPARLGHRPTI
ncbi:type VI secretion system baseplate subunit TssF [Sphingomonas sp. H39-1-10]|uniref:type VI secretion system baseplate subunit TssF n=1 Tax=Sphingomonas pollutisoli TaxID=3030829 RepID=UPI0023B91C4B|nr:type VI secretion system baseplate subunit TssF [Sphingomonas pollutisoli]MDF0487853.1 type VI secretion system baseplate subunit TssF [Sphingomonas pollutisoli]